MPQLDIMSFSTQIFWVLIALSIIYFIILRFVLPDFLLIIRTRSKVLTILQKRQFTLEKTSITETKLFKEAFKHIEETLQNPLYIKKEQEEISSFLTEAINVQRMDFISFLNSLDIQRKLNNFAPFLILIAPTDEFILMISFCFFFFMFYYFVSPTLVKVVFTNQIEELTDNFTKLSYLQKQNLELANVNAQLLTNVYTNSFSALLLYNTLYTTLSLAISNNSKHTHFNETLSVYNPSSASIYRSKARLMRLILSEQQFNPLDPSNLYSKLHILLFICKNINKLDDPFTYIDELTNELEENTQDTPTK